MPQREYNTLFLCTGNSARSIIAEALLARLGQGRFHAFSAGSHPTGEVHPIVLRILRERGLPTAGLRSKSWDEFARSDAPVMDFVFTVCDKAAGEACPVWPGRPVTAHWGVEDPVAVTGSQIERVRAFEQVAHVLEARIRLFLALRPENLDQMSLKRQLDEIGRSDREVK